MHSINVTYNTLKSTRFQRKHSQAVKSVLSFQYRQWKHIWASRTACSGNGQAELSDADRSVRPAAAVTRALFQRADELIWNDRRIANRQLETEPSVFNGSVCNSADALAWSKECACWGPQRLTIKISCEKVVFRHLPVMWLMVKAALSLGMKKESIIVNRRQKYSKWNGISYLILGRSLRQPLQQWKSWPLFLEAEWAIFVILRRGQKINSFLYNQNPAEKF